MEEDDVGQERTQEDEEDDGGLRASGRDDIRR